MLQHFTKLGDPTFTSRYVNCFCLADARYCCVDSLSTLLSAENSMTL